MKLRHALENVETVHLIEALARRHHRPHILLAVNPEIDYARLPLASHLVNSTGNIFFLLNRYTHRTKRPGHCCLVRIL